MGLQGEEYAFGAHYRLRDGRVCFGGPGGFNIFDPARLTESRRSPRLALTNVDVLGVRIELIVCPPAQGEKLLQGDPLRVRQIVMNLVANAVKFTAQGEVVVRADVTIAAAERAVASISVTDTGVGMDAAAVERIFQPFTQADETTTRNSVAPVSACRSAGSHGRRDRCRKRAAGRFDVPLVFAAGYCGDTCRSGVRAAAS